MLVNHVFMLIGILFETVCKSCMAPELLIVGRIFTGFSSGTLMSVVH